MSTGKGRIVFVVLFWLASGCGTASAASNQPNSLVFLSTQAEPAEEAAAIKATVLFGAPGPVDFVPVAPDQLLSRLAATRKAGGPGADVVGALHGDLALLARLGELAPLDDLAARMTGQGVPDPLVMLGRLGTAHQFYIPWMQAGYVMLANKRALPYLPPGADINTLSYNQLATWASTIHEKTGKRLLAFPAGPHGLIDRFFEGLLYPSYTGGVIVPFRSEAAREMWRWFAALWRHVDTNSTTYDSVRQPLISGDVWISFDHVARLLPVLRAKPDEFVAVTAPAGPHGRGYMPILAGLAVAAETRNMKGAAELIDYLRQPETQVATARSIGFFPVVPDASLADADPGLRMVAETLERMRSAPDALLTLLPVGLGDRSSAFDKVFTDTFAQIVLENQDSQAVLDRESLVLQRIITETGAHCWRPDPPSRGPCQVQ